MSRRAKWTFEVCKDEALKYTNCTDFMTNSNGAFQASCGKGWYKDITSHFITRGNKYKRFIYAYEFPDNHVYVGLTYNIEKRKIKHSSSGSVFNYIKETNLVPSFKQLTDTPVDILKAKELEGIYLQQYVEKGWIKLNKANTGGIGGNNYKWNYDSIKTEALKYSTKKDFYSKSKSAYGIAAENNWLEDICKHMHYRKRKPNGYWTFEKCKEESLKYNSRREFQRSNDSVYKIIVKNDWLEELCNYKSYKNTKNPNYWTFEKCREEALKYTKRSYFTKGNEGAYRAALKNGWLDEICNHMKIKTNE